MSKTILVAGAALLVAGGMGMYAWKEENRSPFLEIYAFNLKTSNALFIRTPGDKRILVDGGPNSAIVRKVTDILPFYSRRIDTILVSNPLGKNVAGLIDILNRYDVEEVLIPAITLQTLSLSSTTDQIYDAFLETIKDRNIKLREFVEGDVLDLGVKIEILFPATSSHFQYSKASAPEMIMKISHGKAFALFLGTATTKIQKYVAEQGTSTANVLFIWNNASPDNLDQGLMEKVHPDYLVYSKSLTAVSRPPSEPAPGKKPKKVKTDPLLYLLEENRFNVRAYDFVKIVSDGEKLWLETKGETTP
ncbi:MAG: hypothetical protein WCV79_00225 [Candidatus Paceibacterota bacterium]|jgi:beta-lactamase superfamily II metal-dependent hydrolase